MNESHQAIVGRLTAEITKHDIPQNRLNYQRFSKTLLVEPEGIKTPVLRSISNWQFKLLGTRSADDILPLCDVLLESRLRYLRFFAFDWALKVHRSLLPKHFAKLERWLKARVDSWDSCDALCCGALGRLLLQRPELVAKTMPWRTSKSLWVRRAAAVSLIVAVRKGVLFEEVLACADTLLVDPEDLVQKGYGWMLKEASKEFQRDVFAFVVERRDRMPRTALRYAIEKLPADMRKQAMRKP